MRKVPKLKQLKEYVLSELEFLEDESLFVENTEYLEGLKTGYRDCLAAIKIIELMGWE